MGEHRTVFALLSLVVCNALLAKLLPAAIWSVTGFSLFICVLAHMRMMAPRALLLASPVLLLWTSELFSGILIEHGAYLSETRQRGGPTGGFAVLSVFYSCFILLIASIIETISKKLMLDRRIGDFNVGALPVLIVSALFAITTAYAMLVGLREGFPLLSGEDRLAFRSALGDPLFETWHSNRVIIALFLGMMAAGGWRLLGLTLLLAHISLSVMFAEKFTSLMLIFCAFAMVPGLVRIARRGSLPIGQMIGLAALLAAIAIPATFSAYGGFDRPENAVARISDRLAVQGQAWYLAEKGVAKPAVPALQAISADMTSWLRPAAQTPAAARANFGHYYVVKAIAPNAVFNDFFDNEVGFVFLLLPYFLMLGGLSGAFVGGLAVSALFAGLLSALAVAISRNDYLAVLISAKLLVWQIAGFLLGYLWFFVGIKSMILIAGLFLWRIIHSHFFERETPAADKSMVGASA